MPFAACRPSKPAAKIATWLRQNWGIANSLHWVRDVTYDGDRSTQFGNGAQLTSLLINYAGTPVSKGFRADTIT
jgi:predicted transposase YbfD/YdcC